MITVTNKIRRGFTLVEMLVVISLVGLLMAASLPLIRSITGSSRASSAVNETSASLSAARSIAIQKGRDTAVFFFIDAKGSVSTRVLIRNDDATNVGFRDLGDDRPADPFPDRARVAGPNFAATTGSGVNNHDADWVTPTTTTALFVWFGPDGTTRTSDPALATPTPTLYYDVSPADNAYTATTPQDVVGTVVPYLAVYDQNDFDTRPEDPVTHNPLDATLSIWITNTHNLTGQAQIMMFNRYTGNLLRR